MLKNTLRMHHGHGIMHGIRDMIRHGPCTMVYGAWLYCSTVVHSHVSAAPVSTDHAPVSKHAQHWALSLVTGAALCLPRRQATARGSWDTMPAHDTWPMAHMGSSPPLFWSGGDVSPPSYAYHLSPLCLRHAGVRTSGREMCARIWAPRLKPSEPHRLYPGATPRLTPTRTSHPLVPPTHSYLPLTRTSHSLVSPTHS